jgi:hypothetical protein
MALQKEYGNLDIDKILQLENIKLEKDKIKLQTLKIELELAKSKDKLHIVDNEIYSDSDESDYHITTNSRSPKVYQYNKDTLEFIKSYDCIITTIRECKDLKLSITPLKNSSNENTIYKNFRWLLVDKNITEIPTLQPTKESKTIRSGLVAMINLEKTKIVQVFGSQKEAAIARQHKTAAAINKVINTDKISSGHYWMYYDDCNEDFKDEYLQTNTLPQEPINHNSKTVQKINHRTNEVVKEYPSVTAAATECNIGKETLKKYAKSGKIYNGYKWTIAD